MKSDRGQGTELVSDTISRNMQLLVSGSILKKSVAVIQCKPTNQMSFVAWKLLNVCYYHAQDRLLSGGKHKIHINLLHQYFNYEGRLWSLFNKAFKELQTTTLTFDIFGTLLPKEADTISWSRTQFLGAVSWSKESSEFIYEFGTGVANALASTKMYAKFIMEMQNYFTSAYTLRLYENCIRYMTAPKGSRRFSIQDLKDIFGLEKTKYADFKRFNDKVLKPAIKEINEVSDIEVLPAYIKCGKKVTAIKFSVQKNSKFLSITKNMDNPTNFSVEALIKIMVEEFDVNQKVANDIAGVYGEPIILQAMDYVRATKAYKFKDKAVNLGGYLVDAIRKRYKSKTQEIAEQEEKKRKEADYKLMLEKLGKCIDDMKINFSKHKTLLLNNKIRELGLLQDDSIYDEFEAEEPELITEIRKGALRRDIRSFTLYEIRIRQYICKKHNVSIVCHFNEFLNTCSKEVKKMWETVKRAEKDGVISIPEILVS